MTFFMESVLAWEEGPVFQFQMKSENSSFQKKNILMNIKLNGEKKHFY